MRNDTMRLCAGLCCSREAMTRNSFMPLVAKGGRVSTWIRMSSQVCAGMEGMGPLSQALSAKHKITLAQPGNELNLEWRMGLVVMGDLAQVFFLDGGEAFGNSMLLHTQYDRPPIAP